MKLQQLLLQLQLLLLACWGSSSSVAADPPRTATSNSLVAYREGDDARCHLTAESLERLAHLSSEMWISKETGPALSRRATACVDAEMSHLSVAVPLNKVFFRQMEQRPPRHFQGFWVRRMAHTKNPCHQGRGIGMDVDEKSACAWVAACVPVGCLGDEALLAQTAAKVMWHRLVGSRKEDQNLPELHFDPKQVSILRMFSKTLFADVPKVDLHQDSLRGATGRDADVEIVTCTDEPALAFALQDSLPATLPLRFLRPPGPKNWPFSFFAAERHLYSYVSHLVSQGLGDRLVIYADAWDTDWMGCERNFTKALEALGSPMFFGAEYARYPAGWPGYTKSVVEYPAQGLKTCRKSFEATAGRDADPIDEHEPCLGIALHKHKKAHAIYLNGGVYGGRAWALEKALKSVLGKQIHLREINPDEDTVTDFNIHGKTHQYLWSQYMLDNPEMVSVDFGGAFVVNTQSHHVNPFSFEMDLAEGKVWSRVFQRPICILHGNGNGESDDVMRLMRMARSLRFNPEVAAGVTFNLLGMFVGMEMRLDRQHEDHFVIDTSVCFGKAESLGANPIYNYQARVGQVAVMVPDIDFSLRDIFFFFARPAPLDEGQQPRSFEVVAKVPNSWYIQRQSRRPRRLVLNRTDFWMYPSFDLRDFQLIVQPGDCLGWRCRGLCEIGSLPITADKAQDADVGVWYGPGQDFEVGDVLEFPTRSPFMHVAGAVGSMVGFKLFEDKFHH